MQESRLFRIVYYLLDKGKSTAPELAEKFEVSVRTIYRDIDIISSMVFLFMQRKAKAAVLRCLITLSWIKLYYQRGKKNRF